LAPRIAYAIVTKTGLCEFGQIGLPSQHFPKFPNLSIAFYLLTALLTATPILAIANDAIVIHAVGITAAFMLAAAALGPHLEITTAAQLLKRCWLAALFPIVWMALQIAPLPFGSFANTIWPTTAAALKDPSLPGHISLDPGATLRSLFSYFTMICLAVSAVIITKDRQRAETVLFVLSAVTTFMSVEVLIGQFDSFAGIIPAKSTVAANGFAAAAALAALVNAAIVGLRIERQLTRSTTSNWLSGPLLFALLWGLCGIAASLAAMRALAQNSLLGATGLGFVVIFFIATVRRLGFRPWPSAILFALLLTMAGAVAIPRLQLTPATGLLGFVTSADKDSSAIAERALTDSSWVGSGVGTFEILAKTYRDFDAKTELHPPSSAVSIAIEWGRPALFILVGVSVQLFFLAFFGAIRRGRDSFFPSAAAAGILVVVCEAFSDSSLLNPTVQIIVATLIALGLSQSTGRTSSS
jgi:hypothetical protein